MTELTLIRKVPGEKTPPDDARQIALRADRVTLAKRRWRGHAEDGREFGFDLDAPLTHGVCFFVENGACYVVAQQPEPVLEVRVSTLEEAAAIAWQIGNLHLGIQLLPDALRVVDDSAAAQLFEREHVLFQRKTEIFLPQTTGHHHHHAHG